MEWQYLFLVPVVFALFYWTAAAVCLAVFFAKRRSSPGKENIHVNWPFVSLIKPVCGLEKGLKENLATACRQDYPDYEIIFSVQNPNDPALPILQLLQKEYPARKIRIVVDETAVGPNGRLANIYNGSRRASGEVLVFSDSDMFLEPDYLRAVVAPLANEAVGVSCTLYKAWRAENFWERLELLSFNMDFVTSLVFATVTRAKLACPGASQAVRRETLEKIGGLAPLANYLVEDFELGRRAVEAGFAVHFVPYVARTGVDLKRFRDWWRHQVYWDQNTRAAAPVGFFFTLLIRGIPFALFYFAAMGPHAAAVLAAAFGVRLGTAAANALLLKDRESLKNLWLLPLRDLLGFAVWFASLVKRKTFWKGRTFVVKKGLMIEKKCPTLPPGTPSKCPTPFIKQLVVTADDFGLCPEVNAAVIRAHREGILTDASLMITAQAADEAVRLAKQTPTLKVGLHLVLVEGYSVAGEKLSNHVVWSGVRYFFSKKMRRWVEAECETQIQKFLAAGLDLNHLDSHNHLHIHPVIADIVVRLAKKYKVGRVRVPWQGWSLQTAAMAPWALSLRRRLAAAGLGFNNWMFGLKETGRLTESAWLQLVPKMKEGLTEIYCHPATASAPILQKTMPSYRHLEELNALLSPKVRAALAEKGVGHLLGVPGGSVGHLRRIP